MKHLLVSVYDRVEQKYGPPFLSANQDHCVRQIVATLSDPRMKESNLHQFPGDYDLVKVGIFDDEQGTLLPNVDETGRVLGPVTVLNVKTIAVSREGLSSGSGRDKAS